MKRSLVHDYCGPYPQARDNDSSMDASVPPRFCWGALRARDRERGCPTAENQAARVSIQAAICGQAASQYVVLTADPAVAVHQELGWLRFRGPNQPKKGDSCGIVLVDLSKCGNVAVTDLRTSVACAQAGLQPGSLAWGFTAGRAHVLIQGYISNEAISQPDPRMRRAADLSTPPLRFGSKFIEWRRSCSPATNAIIDGWRSAAGGPPPDDEFPGADPDDLKDIESDDPNAGRVTKFVPKGRRV